MSEPRAYTQDECREMFLNHVIGMVRYWSKIAKTPEQAAEGVAFSILVALDGGAMALPGFQVIPDPHHSDAEFCMGEGENWWPSDVDIGGGLHESYSMMWRKSAKTA